MKPFSLSLQVASPTCPLRRPVSSASASPDACTSSGCTTTTWTTATAPGGAGTVREEEERRGRRKRDRDQAAVTCDIRLFISLSFFFPKSVSSHVYNVDTTYTSTCSPVAYYDIRKKGPFPSSSPPSPLRGDCRVSAGGNA